jgi:hypothetical protein
VLREEGAEFLADRSVPFGPVRSPRIDNHTDAGIAALELNPPSPPTVANEVVGRGSPYPDVTFPEAGMPSGQACAVPITDTTPA